MSEVIEEVIDEDIVRDYDDRADQEQLEHLAEKRQEEEGKVPKGVQKRIDEVTRQKHEAQRKYDQAQADAAALRREIEQLKNNQPKPDAKTLSNGAPDPDKYDAGRYDPDYLEAMIDYKANQLVSQRLGEADKQTSAAKRSQEINTLEAKAKEQYQDYGEALTDLTRHPLATVPAFIELVRDSENPAELSYFLGKNPEELDKIGNMNTTQAMRYIGRLEARLLDKPSLEPDKKPVTNAPKPIAPVGSAKGSAVTKDPAKMTMDEYAAYRRNLSK